jgi:Spy/CpxP family protein refolding chaperone
MLKTILITLLVLGAVGAAGVAWAKHKGYCSADGRMHHMTERVGRKLDLNEDQLGRLEIFAETLKGMRKELRDHRGAMKDRVAGLLSAPMLDRDRAVALIDERYQSMGDNKQAMVDAFADFSDSLNPEQRSQLAGLIGDRMMHRWGHARWAH